MDIETIDQEGRVKEKIIYKSQMLHYGLYTPMSEAYYFTEIPWHWHEEFEFGYVLGGKLGYKTNHREFILQEGDGVFINSGALHALYPVGEAGKIKLQSQFFDRLFLGGTRGSIFDMKYVAPVVEQKWMEAVPVYRKDPEGRKVLEFLKEGIRLSQEGEAFYEFRLRSLFSRLWETVYGWAMEERKGEQVYNGLEDERIKQMMAYVQEHYGEKISVKEMAAQVPISERECYRLFQKGLGLTPVDYMLSYRLQKSQELLAATEKSILDIALETGFGTSSYFGKWFRKHYGMNPKAYREMCREGNQTAAM